MNDPHPYNQKSDKLVRFLTSIPRNTDYVKWTEDFKRVLRDLLDDVDHVTVHINMLAGLTKAEQKWLLFFAKEDPLHDDPARYYNAYVPDTHITIMPGDRPGYDWTPPEHGHLPPFSAIIYTWLKRSEPRIAAYHEPLAFEYMQDTHILGAIFLWRTLDREPVSESDSALLSDLDDVITLAFDYAIARAELERPMFKGTFKAMARLIDRAGLLDHEARVVAYLLLGLTYDQVAARMKFSVNTVRKYIKNVYQKGDVHSLGGLYAKYFLPFPG